MTAHLAGLFLLPPVPTALAPLAAPLPPLGPRAVTDVATEATSALAVVFAVVGGVVAAFLLASVIGVLVRAVGRRWHFAGELSRRVQRPLRAVLMLAGVWIALRISTDPSGWTPGAEQALAIALIAGLAWLAIKLAALGEDAVKQRYPVDMADNRHARRVRTHVQVIRRLVNVVIVVVAAAAILFTFPAMRSIGASILASAGVISLIAGLAAQSSLANLFAGMQIAFTDAVRVDDVVVVDGEWGRVEEITMTYVVVHIWDDRRLILPSTYVASTPFQNWTRRAANLLGTVELDVDWSIPVDTMRAEMHRLLDATDLWDRRVSVLQVTDAVGGFVRIRALASAVDAPTLFDLRCYIREGLVRWLQQHAEGGLPRTRLETLPAARRGAPAEPGTGEREPEPSAVPVAAPPALPDETTALTDTASNDARLFTGSLEAVGRSRSFTGPGREVIEEREHAAEERSGSAETQYIPRVRAPGEGGGGHGSNG